MPGSEGAEIWEVIRSEIRAILRDELRSVIAAAVQHQTREAGGREAGLISFSDAAKMLAISRRTLEDIAATGELRPVWIGRKRLFHIDQIRAFIRAREVR